MEVLQPRPAPAVAGRGRELERGGLHVNLTGDHLDYHKTMEEYGAAKAMLFEALPADGVAVVNIQDVAHSGMVKKIKPGVRVVRCKVEMPGGLPVAGGTAPETVCRAKVMGATTEGTDVEFAGPWGHRTCRIPLVGAFNVMNACKRWRRCMRCGAGRMRMP